MAAERAPQGEACFNDVIRLYNGLYTGRRNSHDPSDCATTHEFRDWGRLHPRSRAVLRWNRSTGMGVAEKMWSSILGIVDASMGTFITKNAQEMYNRSNQIEFTSLAKERKALFITISDNDPSMRPFINVFITQAFNSLMRYADTECEGGRLEIPVRFFLDDFSNLYVPNMADILSVVRSREIWVTMLCQSVRQLDARYGEYEAASIVSNCDTQLLLGICDNYTAEFYHIRANKPASTLLNSKLSDVWLFVRGREPERVARYDLEDHPLYAELPEASKAA